MNNDSVTKEVKEPSSLKLILTLGIAGLISGIAIISIYELTLPTITAYKAKVLREAVFKVLPGVTRIQKMRYADGALQKNASEENNSDTLYAGYDHNDTLIGYAIPGAGPGFQDTIGILYGYKPALQMIVGMEVLESRETPGLGDKIFKDADFQENFKALTPNPNIVLVKKGSKTSPHEVDSISGATISAKAVVRILNKSHKKWLHRLSE
ncbi:MAG: FMN-binding protein [Thiomargarita sp.]|nr:FMN-binding protein [Thiomargarita sp.]